MAQHRPGTGWSRRAVLAASALSLAACSSGHRERPTLRDLGYGDDGGTPTMASLRPLLDRRAAAVKAKDERAFLADLDPGNQELLDQQRMIFGNLRQFKITNFQYVVSNPIAGPVDRDGDVARFGPVHEVLQLSADAGPGGVAPAATFRYGVVRRDGKLIITEIAGLTRAKAKEWHLDGLPAAAPWYLGPLTVAYAGNVCLLGDSSVPDLDSYVEHATAEAHRVEQMWGDRTRFPGYVLALTNAESSFAGWFEAGSAANYQPTIEGYEFPQYGIRQTGDIYHEQFCGSRITVNLPRIKSFGDDPALVMRHELTHAVTARAMAPGYDDWVLGPPTWAVEGFARWNEGRSASERRYAAARFKGRIPKTKDFYGDDMTYNYAVSSTVFDYVAAFKGRPAAVEFYAQVIGHSDIGDQPLVDLPAFQGICSRVLGMSAATFQQRWAGYVRKGS